jgi:myo-inositol-1(or 4)-monophosphatase
LADLAAELAVAAGRLAHRGREEDLDEIDAGDDRFVALGGSTKSSRTDVVTRHDKAAERVIVHGLDRYRPDDAIVGEEGTDRPGTSGLVWHVDPIDGTTNFMYGLPAWSTSIGVVDEAGAVAGAVYVPPTGELFVAARGSGATRNGRPIRASSATSLDVALVATGFGYRSEQRQTQAQRFVELAPLVRDLRRMGSAAIDLAYTAAGLLDVYYEEGLNSWDMTAGELIAREAGCRSGDFRGGPPSPAQLLVAAPGVFEAMQGLLHPPLA